VRRIRVGRSSQVERGQSQFLDCRSFGARGLARTAEAIGQAGDGAGLGTARRSCRASAATTDSSPASNSSVPPCQCHNRAPGSACQDRPAPPRDRRSHNEPWGRRHPESVLHGPPADSDLRLRRASGRQPFVSTSVRRTQLGCGTTGWVARTIIRSIVRSVNKSKPCKSSRSRFLGDMVRLNVPLPTSPPAYPLG
jgi:hypothetical protein